MSAPDRDKPALEPTTPAESPTQVLYERDAAVLVVRSTLLRVVTGPDQGISCPLVVSRVRVGSARDNDLVLTDPGVSRHHLELQIHDRGYLVSDLGSTNGTLYRGARIREVLLGPSAEIRVGSSVLRIERGEEQSSRIVASSGFGDLIGTSPAMQRVYGVLAAVAPTDVTVLLQGETGTGKELVAEALHHASPRRGKLFSVVDCGALPANLIESELFGHEKGAFTGASHERIGVFERSRGGTVFLDEIGELPLELQTRLLRVLDRRTIKRVGGNVPRRVDVRLVAATHRDLAAEVRAGSFRQDLYYRLTVVRIDLPPLRKRDEDVALLARHFLLQAGAADPDAVLTPQLLEVLGNRRWPGNVRELRNVIERAMVMTDGALGLVDIAASCTPMHPQDRAAGPDTPTPPRGGGPPPIPDEPSPPASTRPSDGWLARAMPEEMLKQPFKTARELLLQQFETLYLGRLLERHGNNISAISRDADIDRHMARKLLRKRGLYR